MSRKCQISGTGVMSGNNVSHANNKTRRRFLPNLQVVSLLSEALNRVFKLKICSKTLRTIEHNGGLDAYLENTANSKLSAEALKIKKQLSKKAPAKEKPAKAEKKEKPAKKAPAKKAAAAKKPATKKTTAKKAVKE